jgi:hypothetical protein
MGLAEFSQQPLCFLLRQSAAEGHELDRKWRVPRERWWGHPLETSMTNEEIERLLKHKEQVLEHKEEVLERRIAWLEREMARLLALLVAVGSVSVGGFAYWATVDTVGVLGAIGFAIIVGLVWGWYWHHHTFKGASANVKLMALGRY